MRTSGRNALGVALVLSLGLGLVSCDWRFRHAAGPDEGRFVASRTGETYHRPSCAQAKRIKRRNVLYYKTGDDAYKDRFQPCRICHPEVPDAGASPGPR